MSSTSIDLPKADLLIVDDKPANLRLLAAMLVEQKYKVRSAISGPLALTATEAAPPDIIPLRHQYAADERICGLRAFEG